jgi:hypothetical protein
LQEDIGGPQSGANEIAFQLSGKFPRIGKQLPRPQTIAALEEAQVHMLETEQP